MRFDLTWVRACNDAARDLEALREMLREESAKDVRAGAAPSRRSLALSAATMRTWSHLDSARRILAAECDPWFRVTRGK